MNRLLLLALSAVATSLVPNIAAADWRTELMANFQDQVRLCYTPPLSAKRPDSVVLEVHLNRDGALDGKPRVVQGSPESAAAAAALRAFKKCSPFKIPSSFAAQYRHWKVIQIRFDITN